MTLPKVSAIVLAWKAEPFLVRCVEALLASEKVEVEVVLVDNGCTTDDVRNLSTLDGVVIAGNGVNQGFSGGCNIGVAASSGDYVALINSDLVVEPHTLARLVEELEKPGIGIAAGAVRLAEDPTLLNSSGNRVHVLGISWVGGFKEKETRTQPTETAGAMGACAVLTRAHWDRLGGFDPHYFAYFEDADISLRSWRMGLKVVNVPDATAVHRYEFSRNAFKYYLVERNRLLFIGTLWGWRALLLLSPALLALELGMVLLAAKQGWLPDKVRGWTWLWAHRRHIRDRRWQLQQEKTVRDRDWMHVLTPTIETPLVEIPARAAVNAAMTTYWRLIRRFV